MKREFLHPWRREVLWILLPGIAWGVAFSLRSWAIQLYCATSPQLCQSGTVWALDRWALGMDHKWADHWSFITQAAAFWWSLIWIIVNAVWNHLNLSRFKTTVLDLCIYAQGIVLNGAITESLRVGVQRPRPFVYQNPEFLGLLHAHYTSFVSGHSSFTANIAASLVLSNIARQRPGILSITVSTIGILLGLATAALRVLAGRHFPTDVIGGIAVGAFCAYWIARNHTRQSTDSSLPN